MPAAVAMGEFDEFPARTIEQGEGFGSVFDSTRLGASGTQRHYIADQSAEQVLP